MLDPVALDKKLPREDEDHIQKRNRKRREEREAEEREKKEFEEALKNDRLVNPHLVLISDHLWWLALVIKIGFVMTIISFLMSLLVFG